MDHNTSATTAMSSFHGTGISIFQFPTEDNPGVSRQPNEGLDSQLDTLSLPGSYSIVPPTEHKTTSIKVPPRNQQPIESSLVENMERENLWIKCASANIQQSTTWAAYHSNSRPNDKLEPPAMTALPLLRKSSNSRHYKTRHECSKTDHSYVKSKSSSCHYS